jgi:hypothetical protein
MPLSLRMKKESFENFDNARESDQDDPTSRYRRNKAFRLDVVSTSEESYLPRSMILFQVEEGLQQRRVPPQEEQLIQTLNTPFFFTDCSS